MILALTAKASLICQCIIIINASKEQLHCPLFFILYSLLGVIKYSVCNLAAIYSQIIQKNQSILLAQIGLHTHNFTDIVDALQDPLACCKVKIKKS
jgi:hypothetical protein